MSLYAWRAPKLYAPGGFEMWSREFFLLVNNVLLVVVASLVLWGTLSPLIYEMLGIGKISVGPPVFNLMFLVPMLPLLFFLGAGMHAAWKRGRLTTVAKPLWWLLGVAVILALAISLGAYGRVNWLGLLGIIAGLWILFSSLLDPLQRLRGGQRLSGGMLGMAIAHFGVGLFAIGVSGVQSYKVEKDVALKPGASYTISGYTFKYKDAKPVQGPNYDATQARVELYRGDKLIARLDPQKRRYWARETDMSEAAIDVGWGRDLFVAMGDDLGQGAWSMRIQYKPLIRLIWLGALVMAVGGVVAASDRRYRQRVRDAAPAAAGAEPARSG
ncbi:MAG: cytochrome c-type biogenesis CcmF C-terminal domain-containing protein [Steroidobacteraceae bacterium]